MHCHTTSRAILRGAIALELVSGAEAEEALWGAMVRAMRAVHRAVRAAHSAVGAPSARGRMALHRTPNRPTSQPAVRVKPMRPPLQGSCEFPDR